MTDERLCIGSYAAYGRAADALRQRVFIDEQGVPEEEIFDGLNESAVHVVLFAGDEPAATVRLLPKADNAWDVNCVAVDASRRGQHLGERVMRAAMAYAAARGGREITLSAQHTARGFYEKLGFAPCGEPVVFESGFILIPMKRVL